MKAKSKKILNVGEAGNLGQLHKGQTARIVRLKVENPSLYRRLLDMGITEGVCVRVKKIAPMGDPVDIELRGYELLLRKSDMAYIDVEVVG